MPGLSGSYIHMSKSQKDSGDNTKAWWQPALVIFARMSGWIFFPILAGIFIGKWLDERYGTEPWLFLLVLGLSFVISITGLIKISVEEMKKIEKEEKDKDHQDDDEDTN